jgi:hypothetical protein
MDNAARVNALQRELGPYYKEYQQLKNIKKLQGAQARLPFQLTIQ